MLSKKLALGDLLSSILLCLVPLYYIIQVMKYFDILQIISGKDDEFTKLQSKITQSEQR